MKTLMILSMLGVSWALGATEVSHSYASRAVSSVGEPLDSSGLFSVDWSEPGRFEMIRIGFLLFLR